jgi:hypothetical protein
MVSDVLDLIASRQENIPLEQLNLLLKIYATRSFCSTLRGT